jgi:hypothetical protein
MQVNTQGAMSDIYNVITEYGDGSKEEVKQMALV